jgi:TRAP transporter TAXI family solute receptor
VKMVIVPIPADVVAKVNDPAYIAAVIPANTYEGQTANVATVAIENFLVTHEGVPTDVVYKMTKSLYENLDQMVAAHAAAKAIKREDGPKHMPLPLHPGAEKYYREVGLIK